MNIELIAIGNEILSGRVVNTNVAFLSEQIALNGWNVQRHITLPDDPKKIEQGIKESIERAAIIIVTGGLGPTCDDLTRNAMASIFNSDFYYDENVAQDLIKRYGKNLLSLEDQATIPSKAVPILNKFGTAPGLIFKNKKSTLFALPGVPHEMEQMFINDVLPYLYKLFDKIEKVHTRKLHICLNSESSVDPTLRNLQERYPELDIGIYPSYGILTVVFRSKNLKILESAQHILKEEFDTYVFESSSGLIEEAVHQAMGAKGKKLALAESCTGGSIAARLTSLPGSSDYFLGSVVVYSNEFKHNFLHVSKNTLLEHGGVSRQTVSEMLVGLFKNTTADYGVAVSGIAGPSGGTLEKPIGTIWAAIGERGKEPDVSTFTIKGSRKTIITVASVRLLSFLWRKVLHGVSSFS